MNFKTLVRSISPFVKKKDSRSNSFDSKQEAVEEPPASTSYTWDLSNIDLTVALKHFYKEHNPEKVNTIEYILGQYVNEEVLMLQTLCERYNIDEEDMQYYLDKGKQKKKDRKKSVVTESKSVKDSSTIDETKGPSYTDFTWKLSGCDVGASLKQLYKDHNPLKTPNIALLVEKTNEETINLLQQLCKRHTLSEADMQRYLDMFNKKKSTRGSVVTSAPPSSHNAPVATPEPMPPTQSKVPFASNQPSETYTTLENSPLPNSRYQPAPPTGGSDSGCNPPPPPPVTPKVSSPPPPLAKQPSSSSQSPPPPPPGASPSIGRPPPPGEPTNTSSGPSAPVRKTMAQSNLFQNASPTPSVRNENTHPTNPGGDDDAASQISGLSKLSQRPVLAGGKRFSMGPVLREISGKRSNVSNPSDSVSTPPNEMAVNMSQSAELELKQMREELELARKQMIDVSKESQQVMKMLKDNAETINTNLNSAALTAISLAQQQQEQMELEQKAKDEQKKEQIEAKRKAAAARAVEAAAEKKKNDEMPKIIEELTKEKTANTERIKMLEDLERQLRTKCDTLQQKHDEMKEQWGENKVLLQDALDDKEDLLQLISVMHSSPIAVKNILESFLTKLGQSTGSMSVMLGVSQEGTPLSISERISEALKIKRDQGRELSNVLSPRNKKATKADDSSTASVNSNNVNNVGNGVNNNSNIALMTQTTSEGAKFNKVTEEEFKNYQRINQQNNISQNNTNGTNGSNNVIKRGNDSPSMRSLQRSNAGTPTSPKSADQLMGDQYELAKKYFDNQRANTRIAHQMEESNLAIQEMKTEQMISKTLESNKKMTNTQLADDWIECYDPRTKKTYFHSPSLKKSTWHKPVTNSNIVANSTDKSLHPTYLQMQQGGKAIPNGMSVLTGNDNDFVMGGGHSSPPSRYNSPSLSRGFANAYQSQPQFNGAYYTTTDSFQPFQNPVNSSYNSELQRSLSALAGNRNSNVDDDIQMQNTLNDIINRSKNSTQQQISQQQLYLQQQMLQAQGFSGCNTTPMSADELMSAHLDVDVNAAAKLGNFPIPSNAPSVITENSLAEIRTNVSNSSRPSSASRARPPPNNGGRTSRSASPQLPTKGQMGSNKQQSSSHMPWVMAVDPKSQRKYWYNRETKVSTWRMPVELMN